MARIEYNKLIRDRIPEIIEATGKSFETAVMPEEEYQRALLSKLVEEANEAAEAGGDAADDLTRELADIYEIVDAVIETFGLDKDRISAIQKDRNRDRGGFRERLKLLWVE